MLTITMIILGVVWVIGAYFASILMIVLSHPSNTMKVTTKQIVCAFGMGLLWPFYMVYLFLRGIT